MLSCRPVRSLPTLLSVVRADGGVPDEMQETLLFVMAGHTGVPPDMIDIYINYTATIAEDIPDAPATARRLSTKVALPLPRRPLEAAPSRRLSEDPHPFEGPATFALAVN